MNPTVARRSLGAREFSSAAIRSRSSAASGRSPIPRSSTMVLLASATLWTGLTAMLQALPNTRSAAATVTSQVAEMRRVASSSAAAARSARPPSRARSRSRRSGCRKAAARCPTPSIRNETERKRTRAPPAMNGAEITSAPMSTVMTPLLMARRTAAGSSRRTPWRISRAPAVMSSAPTRIRGCSAAPSGERRASTPNPATRRGRAANAGAWRPDLNKPRTLRRLMGSGQYGSGVPDVLAVLANRSIGGEVAHSRDVQD